jgi:hypothetical protein
MTEGTDYCRRSSTYQTRKSQAEGDFTNEFLDDKEFETKITIKWNNRGSPKQRQLTKSDIVKSQ